MLFWHFYFMQCIVLYTQLWILRNRCIFTFFSSPKCESSFLNLFPPFLFISFARILLEGNRTTLRFLFHRRNSVNSVNSSRYLSPITMMEKNFRSSRIPLGFVTLSFHVFHINFHNFFLCAEYPRDIHVTFFWAKLLSQSSSLFSLSLFSLFPFISLSFFHSIFGSDDSLTERIFQIIFVYTRPEYDKHVIDTHRWIT